MRKIRVLLVDDHTIVREGLCALLELSPEIEIVGEAGNGNEALEIAGKHKIDIVLMDLSMPGMSGLEATLAMCKEFPGIKVIILTQYSDEEHVFLFLRPALTASSINPQPHPNLFQLSVRSTVAIHIFLRQQRSI